MLSRYKKTMQVTKLALADTPKLQLVLPILLSAMSVSVAIFAPWYTLHLIGDNTVNLDFDAYTTAFAAYVALLIVISFLRSGQELQLKKLAIKTFSVLEKKLVRKHHSLPREQQLEDDLGSRLIINTRNNNASATQLMPNLGKMLNSGLELITTAIVLSIFYPVIGGALALSILLYVVASFYAAKLTEKYLMPMMMSMGGIFGAVNKTAKNYDNVQYFNGLDYEVTQLEPTLKQLESTYIAQSTGEQKVAYITKIFIALLIAGAYFYLKNAADASTYDASALLFISMYLFQTVIPFSTFSTSTVFFNYATLNTSSIADFFKTEESIVTPDDAYKEQVLPQHARVEFEEVSLKFKQNQFVSPPGIFKSKDKESAPTIPDSSASSTTGSVILDNVSFVVKPGQKLAIVGSTGAGKSTIGRLLLRMYDPNTGVIKINGMNLCDFNLHTLREIFAVVPQEATLFNRSFKENIIYANRLITDDDIEHAIDTAGLRECVNRLPQGINTIIGEHGAKLSGGERQRLAIARAVIRNASIFLLDEPTASLDPMTEKEVADKLDQVTSGYTTIIITHRLSTVTNADQILYIEDGKIVERGTFMELMRLRGKFFHQYMVHIHSQGGSESELTLDAPEFQPRATPAHVLSIEPYTVSVRSGVKISVSRPTDESEPLLAAGSPSVNYGTVVPPRSRG